MGNRTITASLSSKTEQGVLRRYSSYLVILAMVIGMNTSVFATTYYDNNTDIGLVTGWWTNTNGTGSNPLDFITANDVFIIQNGNTAPTNTNVTFGASVTLQVDGAFTIRTTGGGRTLTVNGTIIFTNTTAAQWTTPFGTFVLAAGATLKTANVNGLRATNGSLNTTTSGTATLNIGANYEFNGAAQVMTGTPATVNNLTFSGSGAKTLLNTLTTVSGTLTMSGAATTTTTVGLTISTNLVIGDGTTFTSAGFALTVTGTTTIGGGTSGNLTINNATGAKLFTGLVSIAAGGTWNNSGNSAVELRGGITNNPTGVFTAGTGAYTFTTNAQNLNGTLSIPTTTVTAITVTNIGTLTVGTLLSGTGNLTNSATGTVNISGTAAPSCSITTLTNAGIINISISNPGTCTTVLANFTNTSTINITGSGTIAGITNNTAGTVNHAGSSTITSFNNATSTSILNISALAVPTITTLTLTVPGNTVIYSGAGAQTVKAVSYENLILSGSGAKALLAGTAVLGEMSVAPTGSATASIGAGLNLIVNSLLLGGVNQVSGTYGSTTSTATYQNNTYFAATTGILSVNIPIVSTAAGGDWATTTTWVGNVVPTATQQVVIATTGASSVTVGASAAVCKSLTINASSILNVGAFTLTVNTTTNATGTFNFTSATGVKTFTGSVTLNSGAVWNETAAAVMSFADNFTNNGTTFTASTGVHTFSGTTRIIDGALTTSIGSVAVTGTYTNNGTLTVGTALTGVGALTNSVTGTLNLSGAGAGSCAITTLTNAGIINRSAAGTTTTALANFTNKGTINISGSGTITGITNSTAGIVNHSGSSTITSFNNATSTSTLNISTTPTVPTFTTLTVSAAGNTVNYTGTGAQTARTGTNFSVLGLSGSGIKTMTGITTIGLDFNMSGSATATIVITTIGRNVSISGTAVCTAGANNVIAGTLTIGTGASYVTASTFTLGVTSTTSVTGTFTLGGTGTKTFSNDVTLNSGGVWNETGIASYSFGGSLTNNATTFTANTGVHTFSGTVQTISGTSTVTIPNLTISGTITNNGTLAVGTVLTGAGSLTNSASGTLNLSGAGAGSCAITTLDNAGIINRSAAGTTTTALANFTNTGTINITGSGTITGITNNANGIVNHSGSSTITSFDNATSTSTLNISTTPTVPTITTLTIITAGNTVNYNGAGTQTVIAALYQNLILSGSGAKAMVAGTSVLDVMSIAPTGAATASVGAGLNLIVNSLLLAGINQASGTYGSTSSAATFKNDTYFSATTGILSVNMPIVSTAAGGDWATTTTWVGSVVPVATQKVIIATTGAGAVTTTATSTCYDLTINSGSVLTLMRDFIVNGTASISGTINFGSTNPTVRVMTFNGSVTLNSGAVWDETNGGANTVLNTYFFSNNFTNDATAFTSLAGLHTFSGTGMLLSGGTTTSIDNIEVTGTYTNTGTLTVGTALTGAGTLTNGNGTTGTLNIGGTATITALTTSATNNTVNYTGGAQTIYVPTSGIYHHLTFSGSAAKTLDVGITAINGNFTMAGTATTTGLVGLTVGGTVTLGVGVTFTAGAFTHNVAGDWINNGGTFTNTGSTIIFNGTGAQTINSGGSSFNNFTITNTGGVCTAAANNITVDGTFTTNASTVLDMATFALSVATVAHSGTLKTQNVSATPLTAAKTWGGLVEYNSASDQTVISGTYNNLVISNAGVKTILTATTVNCQTITFNDAATLEIAGTGLFNVLG